LRLVFVKGEKCVHPSVNGSGDMEDIQRSVSRRTRSKSLAIFLILIWTGGSANFISKVHELDHMPKISEWGPIAIYINTRGEHNPPHFHVVIAEWEASIRIADFGVMAGRIPPRQLGEVVEWAALHQNELMGEWDKMRSGQPLGKIGGLK